MAGLFFEPGNHCRLSSSGWHTRQRARGGILEQDRPVRSPRSAPVAKRIRYCLRRSVLIDVQMLQLAVAKEPDGPAVGGPERIARAFGACQRLRRCSV